jgi:2-phospho-L-lactate transferase/gluconeogenesis factor (CofD/UPF0052 family)
VKTEANVANGVPDRSKTYLADKLAAATYWGNDNPPLELIAAMEAHRVDTRHEIETKFWSIVDADGLAGLPSDMWDALERIARAARNRDMWKAQSERQAETINQMRDAIHDAIVRPMGVVPASAEPFYSAAYADTRLPHPHNPRGVRT